MGLAIPDAQLLAAGSALKKPVHSDHDAQRNYSGITPFTPVGSAELVHESGVSVRELLALAWRIDRSLTAAICKLHLRPQFPLNVNARRRRRSHRAELPG